MGEQNAFTEPPQPKSTEHEQGGNWLAENVGKPLYNGLIADSWNALANLAHVDSAKVTRYEEAPAAFGTVGWATQGIVHGASSLVPYVGASLMAGGILSRGSRVLQLGETGSMIMRSEMAANIGGAALYNGFRDTMPGETTAGNIASGVAGMFIYSAANPYIGRFTGAGLRSLGVADSIAAPASQILTRGLLGSATAPAAMMIADGVARDEAPSWSKLADYEKAAISGFVFNAALPDMRGAATRAVDSANLTLGRGMPLDRFIARNGLSADAIGQSNSLLPAKAQFDLSNGLALDTYAPHMSNLRVQPTPKAVNPLKPDLIYLRQGELTAIQPLKPPEGLTPEQTDQFNQVQQSLKQAHILGRQVAQQSWARNGKAVGAGASNLGLSDMLVNGSVKISVPDEQGVLQQYAPRPEHVGRNTLDVRLGSVFFKPNSGADVTTAKTDLKANVAKYTRIENKDGVWLEPGETILGQTLEHFSFPPGSKADGFLNMSPPVHADIEGTTWLARNNLRVHQTANTIHNGTDHPITLEFVNESENRIFLKVGDIIKVGDTIAQMKFKTLDAHPEGVSQRSHTNGQADSRGSQDKPAQ